MREIIGKRVIICDGAMGTMLQKYGLKAGELPELLNFTNPKTIERIHREYLEAGSDFVSTNTFGASELKLSGSGYSSAEVVRQAVTIARQATDAFEKEHGQKKYVALDLGSNGKLMEPVGDLTFEAAYELFKIQILAGVSAGADFIFFETFTDVFELKAAVIAAKENSDLPIFCSVTFQQDGRTLMGTDPLTMVIMLSDLGIDALGVNCSLGPEQMLGTVRQILKYARLPVLVQPNAGLPCMKNGETVYDISEEDFVDTMGIMISEGVSIVGGCCGTTPAYIAKLAKKVAEVNAELEKTGKMPVPKRYLNGDPYTAVCSATKTVLLDDRIRIIGERINPTGKKLLKEALKAGDLSYIEQEAIRQVRAGAEILDINVGLPEIDEKRMMLATIRRVAAVVDAPLQIDSADPEVLSAAVRTYNGRPIINSVSGKESVMHQIFPIVKKYGTCVIALTLDENGLPKNKEERVAIAEKIIKTAENYGIGRERIIVDCLTLTVSAEQHAAKATLEAITEVKAKFGVKTTLGASNISFGLPERKLLNRTFLAMALQAGLDAPITDPLEADYVDTIRAFEVLNSKDRDSRDYVSVYGGQQSKPYFTLPDLQDFSLETIILEGYEDQAAAATQKLLQTRLPLEIVERIIIPSLEIVGQRYEKGEFYLPQLIKSADTVKSIFEVLKNEMKQTGGSINYGKIVVATVKGDIHDIGKNIAKVMLENYGYEVIDLGKDVAIEKVVRTVREENIGFVGLSALMTTTVVNMEATIKALKAEGLACKILVGGAVLTPAYAEKIGADYFGKDAMATVKAANEVFHRG